MFHEIFLNIVVISFQISNFELSETANSLNQNRPRTLWLAFKLVTLSYQKQQNKLVTTSYLCCD